MRFARWCLIAAAVAPGQSFTYTQVRTAKRGADQGIFIEQGRVEIHGATMLEILADTYGTTSDLIVGGPPWLNSDRFDIVASAPPATPQATLLSMLQTLLADRFKLAIRREERPMPAYALTVSPRGIKFSESRKNGDSDCRVTREGAMLTADCHNLTMADFVARMRGFASNYVDRPAVDRSGLAGQYDFRLHWAVRAQLPRSSDPDSESMANVSFFDGLEKQLGLKLELKTEPRAVIAVDRVERVPAGAETGGEKPSYPTEFEVASVKPVRPDAANRDPRVLPGGQLELYETLRGLITSAYDIDDYMVVGPKWIDDLRFEVISKTDPGVPFDGMRVMLQHLLIERFKLASHRETRPVEVWALTAGKSPKLKKSAGDARSECSRSVSDSGITFTCSHTTMAQLAERLREAAPGYIQRRPVIDSTNLTEAYDFAFTFTAAGRLNDSSRRSSTESAATPTGDASLFESIEKYLGLKLAGQKQPMPVLVIDHIEKMPSSN